MRKSIDVVCQQNFRKKRVLTMIAWIREFAVRWSEGRISKFNLTLFSAWMVDELGHGVWKMHCLWSRARGHLKAWWYVVVATWRPKSQVLRCCCCLSLMVFGSGAHCGIVMGFWISWCYFNCGVTVHILFERLFCWFLQTLVCLYDRCFFALDFCWKAFRFGLFSVKTAYSVASFFSDGNIGTHFARIL